MNSKIIFGVWVAAVVISACNEPDEEIRLSDPTYTYTVTYSKSKDSTFIEFANLLPGGEPEKLTQGDTITMNGIIPVFNNFTGNYNLTLKGLQDINFVLAKTNTGKFFDTARFADVGDINFSPNIPLLISRSAGAKFSWVGPALQQGAWVGIMINGKNLDGSPGRLTVGFDTTAASSIPTNYLSIFAEGPTMLSLVRKNKAAPARVPAGFSGVKFLTVQVDTAVIITK